MIREQTAELLLTRFIRAPRENVFRAWTDEKQAARWWSPKGFSTEVCELEAKPGGILYIEMKSPEGTIYPMTGNYHEVLASERLVFSCAPLARGEKLFEVLHTLTLEQRDGGTFQTLQARVVQTTPESSYYLQGMEEGWNQTLDKLEKVLSVKGKL